MPACGNGVPANKGVPTTLVEERLQGMHLNTFTSFHRRATLLMLTMVGVALLRIALEVSPRMP